MEFRNITIKIKDLIKNYTDDGDGGVFAYDNKLVVRPPYQREFIYDEKKRNAVMDTVIKGYPLNLMWWAENEDGTYELMDGQQRTISICQYAQEKYVVKDLNGNTVSYPEEETEFKKKIDDYELMICVCKGTSEEKLNWFKTINIAGERLTNQELLNAVYTGTWLSDAKKYFSKKGCAAADMSNGFLKNKKAERQDYLETALKWICDRDGIEDIGEYMSLHRFDKDAKEVIEYFEAVINWAKDLFKEVSSDKYTGTVDWGLLYNKYKDNNYDADTLKGEVEELGKNRAVTKNDGIIPYLLSDRTKEDERWLSIRAFDERDKLAKWGEQKHICPLCGEEFKYEEMQGDHIIPWSKGGLSIYENLQMLCRKCNNGKSNK